MQQLRDLLRSQLLPVQPYCPVAGNGNSQKHVFCTVDATPCCPQSASKAALTLEFCALLKLIEVVRTSKSIVRPCIDGNRAHYCAYFLEEEILKPTQTYFVPLPLTKEWCAAYITDSTTS